MCHISGLYRKAAQGALLVQLITWVQLVEGAFQVSPLHGLLHVWLACLQKRRSFKGCVSQGGTPEAQERVEGSRQHLGQDVEEGRGPKVGACVFAARYHLILMTMTRLQRKWSRRCTACASRYHLIMVSSFR